MEKVKELKYGKGKGEDLIKWLSCPVQSVSLVYGSE